MRNNPRVSGFIMQVISKKKKKATHGWIHRDDGMKNVFFWMYQLPKTLRVKPDLYLTG